MPRAASSCPQAGWPWSHFTVADPDAPLHTVCAGAASTGRVIRRVLEEEGCPPGLELEPQLKWLRGQYSDSPCPRGSSSAISPTARSTLQQDKRALSPGNSWLSYFSFRPHLLVGAVVTSQAGHDIQNAFFRSPRAKPNLPLQLCREKCRGKSEKLGNCWRGTGVYLGNCLLFPWALLPILKPDRSSLDPRHVGQGCSDTLERSIGMEAESFLHTLKISAT